MEVSCGGFGRGIPKIISQSLPVTAYTISHYKLSFWAAASALWALAAAMGPRPPAGRRGHPLFALRKPWLQNGISLPQWQNRMVRRVRR
jgi:hypothetical protein